MSADDRKIVFWWVVAVLSGALSVWLTGPSSLHRQQDQHDGRLKTPLQSGSQNRHHPDNGYKEGNIYVG